MLLLLRNAADRETWFESLGSGIPGLGCLLSLFGLWCPIHVGKVLAGISTLVVLAFGRQLYEVVIFGIVEVKND